MAELIKFTEEELTKLTELQNNFNTIIVRFGQLNIDEINLSKASVKLADAKKKLHIEFEEITVKEREIAEQFNVKYGPGTLDPATGIFTPNSVTQ